MSRTAKITFCCSAAIVLVWIVGCGHIPQDKDGTWTASWYGEPFHGRKTASGEIYNMYGVTAAHTHLPFGTRLHLTNPRNGNNTVVTINDRGPFVRGRDLDLSLGAARKLDMVDDGVIIVDVRVLKPDQSYTREISNEGRGFAIQLASFSEERSALNLKEEVQAQFPDARITTIQSNGKKYYRVLVGTYDSQSSAATDVAGLKSEGYSPLIREFF